MELNGHRRKVKLDVIQAHIELKNIERQLKAVMENMDYKTIHNPLIQETINQLNLQLKSPKISSGVNDVVYNTQTKKVKWNNYSFLGEHQQYPVVVHCKQGIQRSQRIARWISRELGYKLIDGPVILDTVDGEVIKVTPRHSF